MVKNNYFVDIHDKVSAIRHKSVKHRCRFIVSNVLCKKTIQKKSIAAVHLCFPTQLNKTLQYENQKIRKMLVKSYLGKVRIFDIAPVSTASEVVEVIRKKQEIPRDIELQCQQDGRILSPESDPTRLTSPVSVVLAGGLPGGKGGFGSLLRSIGAQIEKTTNHEAMR